MFIDLEHFIELVQREPWTKAGCKDEQFWERLAEWVEEHMVAGFLRHMTRQVDEIVEIDPDLSERQILRNATQYMVEFLNAHHASVRIYDPYTSQMLSFGSFPHEEETREKLIPLENSIAGEVVKTRSPYLVPDILDEERYHNKEVIYRKGVRSLIAVPFEIPRFFSSDRDLVGVIQIYYSERGRKFSSLEVDAAKLMAKRLSFVIARKKIHSMQKAREKRKVIVQRIFRTMGTRGGIKMKEVFDSIIPELADIVDLQSCALFSVSEDQKKLILEASYPETTGHHATGNSFPISDEPAFGVLLNLSEYSGDSTYEIVTPFHILVLDPQKSDLISNKIKGFAANKNINSILYIPLSLEGETSHVMTFDALDQRKRYSDDEIDTFLFLGRELLKAKRMERLDDALHDFKNPAIATAGFARRLKKLLEQEDYESSREQIQRYADILLQETSRLQELALSIYQVGDEQILELTEVLRRRFEINREAIKEQLKQNVSLKEGPFDHNLKVKGYVMHLERVFDNLLNNATKAIPIKGGRLSVRTYRDGRWTCAEITNTGHISEDDRLRILEGEGDGRGLYITHRIMKLLKGRIDIKSDKKTTTFVVRLPGVDDPE